MIKIAKRTLSTEEKNLCLKAIKKYKDGKKRLEVKLRELDHMISEGLYINYLEKKDELKARKRAICQEMQEIDMHVITLNNQIQKGVEVKQSKKEEK